MPVCRCFLLFLVMHVLCVAVVMVNMLSNPIYVLAFGHAYKYAGGTCTLVAAMANDGVSETDRNAKSKD